MAIHAHDNQSELNLVTDGDHDARTDNPHGVTPTQVGTVQVLSSNTTLYVATDGNDSRTFAQAQSAGTPLATPGKALELLADKWIAPGVTVTVQLADGTYTLTETLTFDHPQGRGLLLQGNTSAGTSNYILAQSGQIASTSGDDCILHVSGDVTARFPAGAALYLSGSTATPDDNNGYYYVTAVSYDGSKTLITLGGANSATQMPDPTESCDGSTQQVTDAPWSHKVTISSPGRSALRVKTGCAVSGLAIVGDGTAGTIGIQTGTGSYAGATAYLGRVLVDDFNVNVDTPHGGRIIAYNYTASPAADLVVNGGNQSLRATEGGVLMAVGATVIGATTGTYAFAGGNIRFQSGTYRSCSTDSSPAVNTSGNANSYVYHS